MLIEQRENAGDGKNKQTIEEVNPNDGKTWAGVVANQDEVWKKGNLGGSAVSKKKLGYVPPSYFEGKPVVHLDSKKFEPVHKRYEKMVVGGFVR